MKNGHAPARPQKKKFVFAAGGEKCPYKLWHNEAVADNNKYIPLFNYIQDFLSNIIDS